MAEACTWGDTACWQNLQTTSCPSSGAPQLAQASVAGPFMISDPSSQLNADLYATVSAAQARRLVPESHPTHLEQAVRDPGFTPALRDVAALVDLLNDEDLAKGAERAIARVGPAALETLRTRFEGARPPLRGRVMRVIGRLAADPGARKVLLAALDDGDAKTRRNAAIALGHVPPPAADVESALLRAWDGDPRVEMRRSIAASLGKLGTEKALGVLSAAGQAGDPELTRIAERAIMMIERTASRARRGAAAEGAGRGVDASRAAPGPTDLVVASRKGLEALLADELSELPAVTYVRVAGAGTVRAQLLGSLQALFAARTMLSFRFPLPAEWVRDGEQLEDAVARAVTSDAARAIFAGWTEGAVRYRIAWAEGGHKRAATWGSAQAIARRSRDEGASREPELINDPTESNWEVLVSTKRRFVDVELAPRGLADPRFAWRRADVPAASHPTIAAALAIVAGARDDDVVWDPFVGSGAELVERGRLGPYVSLLGTDVDSRALAAARMNLAAAGVQARLERGDALSLAPAGVTLVLTNPPMGRRAARGPGLAEMLDRFVARVATLLVPGGRLVWIAPWPRRARAAAAQARLELGWARVVDMGGFDAEMQRWIRRA
jgi:23S rRNA G2445 N2-methylase RlmL